MALPLNTSKVLEYMGYSKFRVNYRRKTGEVRIFDWDETGLQPDDSAINAAAASPEFADWLEGHGGDPVKTLRRKAREALANVDDEATARDMAIAIELLAYARHIAKKHNDLLAWLGTQGVLTNRGQLTGFAAVEPTNAQAKAAIDGRIAAGEKGD